MQKRCFRITIGDRGQFREHIEVATSKAETRMAALAKIMTNIGGPGSQKRRVLSGIIYSILLYAAPVWHTTVDTKIYTEKMGKDQHKAAAYRTPSSSILQVITGIPLNYR